MESVQAPLPICKLAVVPQETVADLKCRLMRIVNGHLHEQKAPSHAQKESTRPFPLFFGAKELEHDASIKECKLPRDAVLRFTHFPPPRGGCKQSLSIVVDQETNNIQLTRSEVGKPVCLHDDLTRTFWECPLSEASNVTLTRRKREGGMHHWSIFDISRDAPKPTAPLVNLWYMTEEGDLWEVQNQDMARIAVLGTMSLKEIEAKVDFTICNLQEGEPLPDHIMLHRTLIVGHASLIKVQTPWQKLYYDRWVSAECTTVAQLKQRVCGKENPTHFYLVFHGRLIQHHEEHKFLSEFGINNGSLVNVAIAAPEHVRKGDRAFFSIRLDMQHHSLLFEVFSDMTVKQLLDMTYYFEQASSMEYRHRMQLRGALDSFLFDDKSTLGSLCASATPFGQAGIGALLSIDSNLDLECRSIPSPGESKSAPESEVINAMRERLLKNRGGSEPSKDAKRDEYDCFPLLETLDCARIRNWVDFRSSVTDGAKANCMLWIEEKELRELLGLKATLALEAALRKHFADDSGEKLHPYLIWVIRKQTLFPVPYHVNQHAKTMSVALNHEQRLKSGQYVLALRDEQYTISRPAGSAFVFTDQTVSGRKELDSETTYELVFFRQ